MLYSTSEKPLSDGFCEVHRFGRASSSESIQVTAKITRNTVLIRRDDLSTTAGKFCESEGRKDTPCAVVGNRHTPCAAVLMVRTRSVTAT